ncbi:hypothetical protein HUJ05_000082 [Dendroctonus ponderosae]|nr:hypothetical protein HUJ05_000082 [Dendroctonus ponderosae]
MALFNISGSKDWEVTGAAQKLCQNFNEGHGSNFMRKFKNNGKVSKSSSKNKDKKLKKKLLKSVSLFNNADLLNGKERLLKEIKKKITEQNHLADDKVALNSSIEISNKKMRKRKVRSKNHVNVPESSSQELEQLSASKHTEAESSNKILKHKKKSKKIKSAITEPLLHEDIGSSDSPQNSFIHPQLLKKRKKQLEKLKELVLEKAQKSRKVEDSNLTLRQRMMRKLKAARFRFLNEQIYNTTGKETEKIFRSDPEAFKAYHEGYKLQLKRWPMNPLDKIIKSLTKMNKTNVIADFGCGEARLAQSVEHKVHSFDLVAANDFVTACDMAHVPLDDSSVDVAVFCLSLMGTNLKEYLLEANRVLKKGGLLKIAEVESRFEDVDAFIKNCEQYGFKKTWMDLSYNLFYFIDFKKESSSRNKAKLPSLTLQPCLYKKRISRPFRHEHFLSSCIKVKCSATPYAFNRNLFTQNDKKKPSGWTEWEGMLKRFVPLGVCLIAVMQWRAYRQKGKGGTAAKQWEINCYCFLPLRTMSRCWGYLADQKLPEFARPIVYGAYSKTFGVNLAEAQYEDLKHYSSLTEFFTRSLKEGVRAIDYKSSLVSPCDGTVLSVGTVNNGRIEQVKGVTYYVQDFLGEKVSNSISQKVSKQSHEHLLHRPHEGNTLYQCVIYLAPGDYHRFHSPAEWKPTHRRHFSGELLSVNPRIAQWLPGLFVLNERAVYLGEWEHGFFSYSAVGATNVGSIRVFFDKTLQTNQKKKTHKFKEICLGSSVDLHKGDLVGEFRMGSTIVIIFEGPLETSPLKVGLQGG